MKIPALPAVLPAVLVVGVVLSLLAAVGPAAHADDTDPGTTATYPDITSFNPDVTPYAVHVESTSAGTLSLLVNNVAQAVPASGDVVPDFAADGVTYLKVQRCDTSCVTSNVRRITVYRHFLVSDVRFTYTSGPHRTPAVSFRAAPQGIAATATWRLVDPDGVVVADGSTPVTTGGVTEVTADGVPDDLPAGAYTFDWSLDGGDEQYGDLSAEQPALATTWKPVADVGVLRLSTPDLYPAQDGYHDSTGISVTAPQGDDVDVVVLDPHGTVVQHFDAQRLHDRPTYTGAGNTGPGTYRVRLTVTDAADNVGLTTVPLRIHAEHLAWATYRHTFHAADTVVKKEVGSCSTLSSPAVHGPRGSLGYYSQSRCSRARESDVITVDGAYVPRAVGAIDHGRKVRQAYRNLQISVTGGAAGGSHHDYAILRYYTGSAYADRVQLSAASGQHAGKLATRRVDASVLDLTGRPRLYWNLGLTAGSRYDVRSFTVRIDYRTLR